MAKWIIDSSTLTDIANAIREKRGTVATIPVNELADEIELIDGGGGGLLRDRLIIPDKYNTGCHGQLKKFDPSTDTSGIGWRYDGTSYIGIDFNKPNCTSNLVDNQVVVLQNYDFTDWDNFNFMNAPSYTSDKSYYRDNIVIIFMNCLFMQVLQNYAFDSESNITLVFCNCTSNRIGASNSILDRCLFGNVTFFKNLKESYISDGDAVNPSGPCIMRNCYIMDIEEQTSASQGAHMDGLQIGASGGSDQHMYNCRFECFDMPYEYSQGGWSYSIFWQGAVTDSSMEYCIFHGGGLYGTAITKAANQIVRNNLVSGEYHESTVGDISDWVNACYPNADYYQMSDEWADYIDTLLVSSIWVEDNMIKICYSNDMHSTRTMRIVDNNGQVTTVSIPACPIRITAETEGITQWSDLPFDRVVEISAIGVDSINIYDGNTLVRTFTVDTAGSISNMAEKTVTQNGTYTASAEGLDGYSKVSVAVDVPTGTLNINQNGTFDVAQYANALVSVSGGGYSYLTIQDITPAEDLTVLEINIDTTKTLNALFVYDTNRTTLQNYTFNDFVIMSAPTNSESPWQACCGSSGYNGKYWFTINNMPTWSVDTTLGVISLGPKDKYYWRAGRTYKIMIIYTET